MIRLTTLAFLCFALASHAQYTVKWTKLMKSGTPAYNFGEDLAIDAAGRLVITGITDSPSIQAVTIGYDTLGNELWRRNFSGAVDAEASRLFLTPSGQFISAGFLENASGTHDIYYNTYSSAGAVGTAGLQASPGFAVSDDFGDAAVDSKGRVYLAGGITYGPNLNASLARFDSGGVMRWWDTLSTPGFAVTFNRGVEVVGDTMLYAHYIFNGYGCLQRYDTSGAKRWRRDSLIFLENNHSALTVDASGNAILGGRWTGGFTVLKMRPSGDTMWRRAIAFPGVTGANGRIHSVATDAAGNIYTWGFGNHAQPVGAYGILAKLNPTGVVQWVDTMHAATGGTHGTNQEFLLVQDGAVTVAVGGFTPRLYKYTLSGTQLLDAPFSLPGLVNPEINAMQYFNGDLYVTGNSRTAPHFIGFTARLGTPAVPLNIPASPSHAELRLYPNPTRSVLHVAGFEGAAAQIIDAAGRTCQKSIVRNGSVNVTALPPGVYTLRVEGTGATSLGSFVKE